MLKAPFPWFGGKSRAASLIWERLGDTPNYVEPFAGSLAVLLARPHAPRIETVNDKDAYLANFWRAVQAAPETVAEFTDWPVNEVDLHARHARLIAERDAFTERLIATPDYFDPEVAGWWAWGLCAWIGQGWCGARPARQLPALGDAGRGVNSPNRIVAADLKTLSKRLRRVRVACGDWERVMGHSVTDKLGVTAVVLDPPYDDGDMAYAAGGKGISSQVREWAIANGDNPSLRIALCGYDGEHPMPKGWEQAAWKAAGGYGVQAQGAGRENASRERVWFSPHCIKPTQQLGMFDSLAG